MRTTKWFRGFTHVLTTGVVSIALCAQAQDTTSASGMHVSGAAAISSDIYEMSASPSGAVAPRRPANLWRLIFTPTITFGDLISLPFTIMISSRETNTVTAPVGDPTFAQFLQNPLNALGFSSFSPRIGWLQLHAGSFQPQFSELSAGDLQIFGAGAAISPGNIRAEVAAGTSRRAIEPDSNNRIIGSYARRLYMAKIGLGKIDESHLDFNYVRATDDLSSVRRRPTGIAPQEGIVLTSNAVMRIGVFSLSGEIGTSVFTSDVGAAALSSNNFNEVSFLINPRTSTHADIAGMLGAELNSQDWGIKAVGTYIGAGYLTLSYPYLQPDRLEFTISPRAQLFDNKLSVNGSVGVRTNNISGTLAATSHQFLAMASTNVQLSDAFSISASFANFGVRNTESLDTQKIETVSRSFSVSPMYILSGTVATHSISITFAMDNYVDNNVLTGAMNSNRTVTYAANYAVSFSATPMSLNLSASRLTNDLPAAPLTVNSVTLGGNYRFDKGTVVPSLSATFSQTTLGAFTPDIQVLARAAVQWRIVPKISFTCAISDNMYKYGTSRPGTKFSEYYLQSSLTTQF